MVTVKSTAEWYGLTRQRAGEIIDHILTSVALWPELATKAGISNADIEMMSPAFGNC